MKGLGTGNAHALTERVVTVAVEQLLTAVGQDATTFSGKCLRRGGLSTAKTAGIPPGGLAESAVGSQV